MTTYTTAAVVVAILRKLERFGIRCVLFGGWAEEALGKASPRPHRDIDLLWPAQSFGALDRLFPRILTEIPSKRFAHKRAFLFADSMVEITLVQESSEGISTLFWGDIPFHWELPLEEMCTLDEQPIIAASRANLQRYREHHNSTQPWRWKDEASLVR